MTVPAIRQAESSVRSQFTAMLIMNFEPLPGENLAVQAMRGGRLLEVKLSTGAAVHQVRVEPEDGEWPGQVTELVAFLESTRAWSRPEASDG